MLGGGPLQQTRPPRPTPMPHCLSGADFLRLALPSTFQEHIFFGWRFFFQPFRSRLLSTGVSSFRLSAADFFRLPLLLSAFREQTPFGWRFFSQPFRSRLPSTDASSFSLSAADFLRLALLLVGTRFFSLDKNSPPNGLAHLPPIIARRQSLKNYFSGKVPLRTHAEGGQVQPVLGGFEGTSVKPVSCKRFR